MTLNADTHRLLELIEQASEPVAMSDFFHLGLYEASIGAWEGGLVEVVHPASGQRPDLVSLTDAGRAAIA